MANKRIKTTPATLHASKNFACWLKENMEANGVSCSVLASAVGLERKAILSYLHCDASPKLDVLAAIFQYFGETSITVPFTKTK